METTVQKISLQIAGYRVRAIPTGLFGLDGGAMFGTVPKVLWEKAIASDDQNRIPMEARCLLLESKDRRILIDCGIGGDFIAKYGEKLGAKFSQMYNVSKGSGVEKTLNSLGLSTGDITDVILTHLHFDHAGGATTERNGKLVPTFENAKYYVQAANLETARKPNMRERASYYPVNFEPLLDAGVLTVLKGPQEEILPGISTLVSNGHTQGQQMVKISDYQTTLVYCADVVPTSAHVRLAWVMGYDLRPLDLIEEKQELMAPAAKNGWYLFFEHDPKVDAAKIVSNGSDYAVGEAVQLV
jgi:glyoxylase-like metal-dependent hydrolase (beta-lactamase superfamily II)